MTTQDGSEGSRGICSDQIDDKDMRLRAEWCWCAEVSLIAADLDCSEKGRWNGDIIVQGLKYVRIRVA